MRRRHATHRGRTVASAGALAGATVVLGSSLLAGSLNPGLLLFVVWALVPYGLLLLGRFVRTAWVVAGAGAVMLAAEVGLRAAVFLFPRGSTAAVALVFSPFLVGAGALPVGAASGWLFGRIWHTGGPLVRTCAGAVAALLLGLLVLALARPELTPWEVAGRRAALARIGEPRVAVGAGDFASAPASQASAWFQVAELDGVPGDEIAVVGHRGATLIDPARLQEVGRVTFHAQSGSLWNWFSVLARLRGRTVIVQTGGGYSETQVIELDGRLVWRHPVAYGSGLALSGPRSPSEPAWVAARSTNKLTVWDETGRPIAVQPLPEAHGALVFAELGDERLVLSGTRTLRGRTLDGTEKLELPLVDFSFVAAHSVRFWPGEPAHLVVAAAGPSDLERGRLLILAPTGTVVYDEILDHTAQPLVAHRRDGSDTLLVGGRGLRVLRPVGQARQRVRSR